MTDTVFVTPYGTMRLFDGQAYMPAALEPDAIKIAEWAVTWLGEIEQKRMKRNAARRRATRERRQAK